MLINKQFYNIIVENVVDSTNNVVKDMANGGEKEGLVFIAHHQTAGKGRLGRTFHSPADTGLYMSVLFRPSLVGERVTLFTTAASLAVCKAIREVTSKNASIKWVNDILINNKKVCGILTEGKINPSDGKMEYVIVGIGINIEKPKEGFPEDISDIASSIVKNSDEKLLDDNLKNKLAVKILDNLYYYYIEKKLDATVIRDEYITYSNTIGKDIYIIAGDKKEEAKAIGIDNDLGLIVKNNNGTKTLSSGEISIRELKKK